jgi:hypothetical protein
VPDGFENLYFLGAGSTFTLNHKDVRKSRAILTHLFKNGVDRPAHMIGKALGYHGQLFPGMLLPIAESKITMRGRGSYIAENRYAFQGERENTDGRNTTLFSTDTRIISLTKASAGAGISSSNTKDPGEHSASDVDGEVFHETVNLVMTEFSVPYVSNQSPLASIWANRVGKQNVTQFNLFDEGGWVDGTFAISGLTTNYVLDGDGTPFWRGVIRFMVSIAGRQNSNPEMRLFNTYKLKDGTVRKVRVFPKF